MSFKFLNDKIKAQFNKMCATGKLFRVNIPGNQIWKTYLESFPEKFNNKFRDPNSSEHNCNTCHSFIKRYGNVVAIGSDLKIMTIFSDLENVDEEYLTSVNACRNLLEVSTIENIFVETFDELNALNYGKTSKNDEFFDLGIAVNRKQYTQEEVNTFGVVNTKDIYSFYHFHVKINRNFIDFSGKSVEALMAVQRDKFNVLKRALIEIPVDTLNLVKDLINQGSLLDGEAHLHAITDMLAIHEKSKSVAPYDLDNFIWLEAVNSQERTAKFRNTLMGQLCVELAEGVELNKACLNWNKRVDPANYMRAVAPITEAQRKEAAKFIEENGYEDSFERRNATINDIKASEILHMNSQGSTKKVSILDKIAVAKSTRHKRSEFDKVEEVSIEKFMKDILPGCTSVELLFESRLKKNLVAMHTTSNPEAKNILKWNNNYSWTYNGNLAGVSQLTEKVKEAGGNVEGILRCSLQWDRTCDLDLWCDEPTDKIGFNSKYRKDRSNKFSPSGGQLDLDNRGKYTKDNLENIYYLKQSDMKPGKYLFKVSRYARFSDGFKAEIKMGDNLYQYEFKDHFDNKDIAEITFHPNGEFTINHILQPTVLEETISTEWGLETTNFHKVNLVCLSPNHWDNPVGNKHYFFMIEGCKPTIGLRSFHNENLNEELSKHRKVLDVLGASSVLEPTDNQLAGFGFNATVKDEVIVKLQGTHKRVVKIKF